jgi:hypothetical protein
MVLPGWSDRPPEGPRSSSVLHYPAKSLGNAALTSNGIPSRARLGRVICRQMDWLEKLSDMRTFFACEIVRE